MRFIEIELDGKVVRAQLNDELAPVTAKAVWDILPFEGNAVHALVGGEFMRPIEFPPIGGVLPVENGVAYQHPGSLIFAAGPTGFKEIAVCYGEGRFRGHSGPMAVTPLGEIEGDFAESEWVKIARKLPETGSKPIKFRQAADQTTPFRYPTHKGPKIEVEFDGAKLTATLLEDSAPKTVAAFQKILPIEGRAWNDSLAGELTKFWGSDGSEGEIPVKITDPENGKLMLWPGYLYYYPAKRGLRIAWGQASMNNLALTEQLTPIAVFDGDWSEFKKRAKAQITEGAKKLAIRKKS